MVRPGWFEDDPYSADRMRVRGPVFSTRAVKVRSCPDAGRGSGDRRNGGAASVGRTGFGSRSRRVHELSTTSDLSGVGRWIKIAGKLDEIHEAEEQLQ